MVTLLQEILSEMLELLSLHQNLLEYFVNGDDVSQLQSVHILFLGENLSNLFYQGSCSLYLAVSF